jgi:hypothetical protein
MFGKFARPDTLPVRRKPLTHDKIQDVRRIPSSALKCFGTYDTLHEIEAYAGTAVRTEGGTGLS